MSKLETVLKPSRKYKFSDYRFASPKEIQASRAQRFEQYKKRISQHNPESESKNILLRVVEYIVSKFRNRNQ